MKDERIWDLEASEQAKEDMVEALRTSLEAFEKELKVRTEQLAHWEALAASSQQDQADLRDALDQVTARPSPPHMPP